MLFQQPAGVPLDAPVDPGALLAAMVGVVFFSMLTAVTRARPLALVWRVGRARVCCLPGRAGDVLVERQRPDRDPVDG